MLHTIILASVLCGADCQICEIDAKLGFDTEMMSGSERKQIFYEIQELKRQAMNELAKAKDISWKMPDIDAQHIYNAILADCYTTCANKAPSCANVCIACLQQLSAAICKKSQEWQEGETLVMSAKFKFKRAENLETKLWTDPDPHDWM